MKILVTGSAGFIGSEICSVLLQNNHTVLGIDNYSKYGIISRPHDNHKNYQFVQGDCKNKSILSDLINQADIVIHAAASIGGIRFWNTQSLSMLIENERITTSLFEAWCNSTNRPKMIILSSSQVYECCNEFPSKEDQLLISPKSGYGLQKLLLESYTKEAHNQHGLIYTILRPFNAYGVGELKIAENNHVMVDLINNIKENSNIQLIGNGQQIRTFTYVNDVANAVLLCVNNHKSDCNIYNVCSNDTISISDLSYLIATMLNKKITITHTVALDNDVQYRVGSYKKIFNDLGWEPKTSLKEGISYMVNNV
jgi:nucleoside-diphosphate-sugar epimerase